MSTPQTAVRGVVAVVPVRAGSRGFPGKNVADLAGKPLYRHAVDQALTAGVRHVVITTDIPEVLAARLPAAVTCHVRPAALAGGDVPMAPVLADVLRLAEFDDDPIVTLLQATSPLRTACDITAAVGQFRCGDADLVMSVCPADAGVLKFGTVDHGRFTALRDPAHPFTNRQALPPVMRPNGAVYVFGAAWFRARATLQTDAVAAYPMSVEDSVDIDTEADLWRCAERLISRPRREAERTAP